MPLRHETEGIEPADELDAEGHIRGRSAPDHDTEGHGRYRAAPDDDISEDLSDSEGHAKFRDPAKDSN